MMSGQYGSTVYDQVEALCVIWASGQVNADLQAIEKALQASGSKVNTKQMLKPLRKGLVICSPIV
jgi:hypothetical protein